MGKKHKSRLELEKERAREMAAMWEPVKKQGGSSSSSSRLWNGG